MSNRNRQVRLSTEMLFAVLVSAAVVYLASQRIGQQIAPGTVGRFLAALMMILLMGCVLKWTGLLRFTGRKAALQSVTVLVTAVSVISGGLAVSAFAVQTGLPLTAEDVSRAVSGAASGAASGSRAFLTMLTFAIAVPISEEIIFRGAAYGALRCRMSMIPAGVTAGALFALVHGPCAGAAAAFISGFLLCILYEITENLAAPMIVHGVNNCMSLTGGISVTGVTIWIVIIVGLVVCAAGCRGMIKIAALTDRERRKETEPIDRTK